jgi:hypothetical protein
VLNARGRHNPPPHTSTPAGGAVGDRCSTDFSSLGKPAHAVVAAAYGGHAAQTGGSGSGASVPIYSDGALASGWDNWSYGAAVTLASTVNPYPGHTASLAANISSYGAVVFHRANTSLAGVATLQMDVDVGNSSVAPQLQVQICPCTSCTGGCAGTGPAVTLVTWANGSDCTLPTSWGAAGHITIPLSALLPPGGGVTTTERIQARWRGGGGGLRAGLHATRHPPPGCAGDVPVWRWGGGGGH